MSRQPELIPMPVSEYLKHQRLTQKLSLATVARSIRLDEKLLLDIEEDRAGHIAAIYRQGYIRTYARYLGIGEDEISELLISEQKTDPELRTIFTEPPKRNPVDNWLRATSYVLASLLIGTLAWQFTHEAVRLSQNGTRLQGKDNGQQSTGHTTNQDSALSAPVNASIASLDVLQTGNNENTDFAEQAWSAVSASTLAEGQSRLKVSVSADSWIEISDADGVELEMDLLRGGSDKVYQGRPPFRILFGRASAVKLSVDGEPVDLGKFTTDDVVQMSWPQPLQAGASVTEQD